MTARMREGEMVRPNAKKRTALNLVSWNVKSFAPRASDVDALIANEDIDIPLVCETKQKSWENATVTQLHFDGTIISMEAHAKACVKRQGHIMGVAFLSKRRGLIRREGP